MIVRRAGLRFAHVSCALSLAAIVGSSQPVRAAACPPMDDRKLASCRSAAGDSSLPQFVDAGPGFGDCVSVADAWRSCSPRPDGVDAAYALLGAAFAIDHDRKAPDVKRAMPYLVAGDDVARRLLEKAAQGGRDADEPYPQLRFLLEHVNHGY